MVRLNEHFQVDQPRPLFHYFRGFVLVGQDLNSKRRSRITCPRLKPKRMRLNYLLKSVKIKLMSVQHFNSGKRCHHSADKNLQIYYSSIDCVRQCDQTREQKVAQFTKKLPKSTHNIFYFNGDTFQIALKVDRYFCQVLLYGTCVTKAFQKCPIRSRWL